MEDPPLGADLLAGLGSSITAFCFTFQAILGVTLFGESQSMRWWIGASLILMGLILIHHSSKTNNPPDNIDQKDQGHLNKDKKE